MLDFKWQSQGGILVDSTGDIASTSALYPESLLDMVKTRLKATTNGWQLYHRAANLEAFLGNQVNEETEALIRQAVTASLTPDLLPAGSFSVDTLEDGTSITILVFLQDTVIATAIVSSNNPVVVL
jgi:hypothetical protein